MKSKIASQEKITVYQYTVMGATHHFLKSVSNHVKNLIRLLIGIKPLNGTQIRIKKPIQILCAFGAVGSRQTSQNLFFGIIP